LGVWYIQALNMSNVPELPAPRVVGRYALFGEIAAGGMATVHLGRLLGPVGFARTVAIKRLHAQFAKDPEFVSMFLDEARLAARIQHPNVVSTLDVVAMSGELFLVMEYVQGESLGKLVRLLRDRGQPIPTKIAGSIISSTLYGLHAAHEAKTERGEPLGIIHRDVSPQNVLVGADGVSRVLDFGVAKAAGRIQTTREGQLKGKIAYMPPEQLAGVTLDRRTDVYAASVVLWELLSSKRLFEGEHEAVVFGKVLEGATEPPSRYHPDLPAGVDEIVMKGLSKDPNRRYSTAHEMAVAVEDALGHASPRKVAEWVDQLAGRSLQKRAAKVKEIESVSSVSARPPAAALIDGLTVDDGSGVSSLSHSRMSDAFGPSTSANTALVESDPKSVGGTMSRVSNISLNTIPGVPRRKNKRLLFTAIPLLIGGLLAFVVFRSTGSEDDLGASRTAASEAPPAVQEEPVILDVDEHVAPTADASEHPAPDESADAPAATVVVEVPAPPRVPRVINKRPPRPPPPKKPKASCNPPYTVDASGIRRIKPECL